MLGVRYERNATNTTVERECYPFVNAGFGWSPNRSHSLNFSLSYAKTPMDANLKSPNVLQDNELLYYSGNPSLKYSPNIMGSLRYNWRINKWLRVSPYVNSFCIFDRYVPIYAPYDGGMAIIREYENNGDHFRKHVGASATATLLDGSLEFQLSPSLFFYRSTGYYDMRCSPFDISGAVNYYVGKFYISCYYDSRYKTMWTNSGTIYHGKSQLQLEAGWSDSKLNVRLSVSNPFRTSWVSGERRLESDLYTVSHTVYNTNAHFKMGVSLTYTFSYGKKVDRGNEVGEMDGAKSAILKN